MKGIVPLSIIVVCCLTGVAVRAEAVPKQQGSAAPPYNVVGSTPKPEVSFNFQQQQQQQFAPNKYQPPAQVVYQGRTQLQQALPYNHQPEIARKIMFPGHNQQPTPVAMVIIAQPAYVPISLLQQNNVAQQLLQYFQGPQAALNRYQFVPANHQPVYHPLYQGQAPPQYLPQFQPHPEPAPQHQDLSQPNPQNGPTETLPTPQALISGPEGRALPFHRHHHHQQQHYQPQNQATSVDFQPQQLQEIDGTAAAAAASQSTAASGEQSEEITRLAQQAAQHFLASGGLNGGGRTAPAIITGLEHFSPEQQEKIKAQLSEHFGSPLKPLNLQEQQQRQLLESEQGNGAEKKDNVPSRKAYQERLQKIKREKFVPSVQVKDGEIRQTSSGDKM